MNAKSVRFINVSKAYGSTVAVNQVSFTVLPGTLMTLLGPSGCGKTTTLRMIAGLEIATSGQIFIGDTEATHIPASERDVSMVFQSYALFPHMSVFENVAYGLQVRRMSKAEVGERVDKMLASVGLSGFAKRLPSELSGGQQQRVAVARALVLEPAVLLFDEPLSNLDARLRRQMREEIRELQQRQQLTVVYVTHDQAEAMAVSDHIIVMNHAVIVQTGTPADLYNHPVSRFVTTFMGEANQVRGRLRHLDAQDGELTLASLRLRLPHKDLPEGEVDASIRPEAIALFYAQEPAEPDVRASGLPGMLNKAVYLGHSMEYTVATEIGDLFVTSSDVHRQFTAGRALMLSLNPMGVILLPKGVE